MVFKTYKFFFSFALFLLANLSSIGQIRINEVCASNESVYADSYGGSPDYVELYNMGSDAINLGEYALGEKEELEDAFVLPNQTLAVGAYVLIHCSEKQSLGNEIHAPFRLKRAGEHIRLWKNGNLEIELSVPATRPNHSYGWTEDGWRYYSEPTPWAFNEESTGYLGYTGNPTFLPANGFFDGPVSCSVQFPQNAEVFLAAGGEAPVLGENLYSAPQWVDSTTVICAIAQAPGFLPSKEVYACYFIDEEFKLPVMSLISEPDDLWSEEDGIMVLGADGDTLYPFFGANFWDNRHIEVHVNHFVEGEEVLNQQAEMRIHGGKSARSHPMKPFRVLAKERYDADRFDYNLIANKDIGAYRKFVLRNSGGDYNQFHFRDTWLHRYMGDNGMDIDLTGAEPAFVFLNGEPWGVMNIREKVGKYSVWQNAGLEWGTRLHLIEEDTLNIEGDLAPFDEMVDFLHTADLNNMENYAVAEQLLDLDSYIDYIIAETYLANLDWPANNIKIWRDQAPGSPWRYMLYDLDVSLNGVGFITPETDALGRLINDFPDNKHARMFNGLLGSDQFYNRFVTRYADAINEVFHPDSVNAHLDAFIDYVEPDMDNHFALRGNSISYWHSYHIEELLRPFLPERVAFARDILEENLQCGEQNQVVLASTPAIGKFEVNTLDIPHPEWEGVYFSEVPVAVRALDIPFHRFSHWESNKEDLDGQISAALSFLPNETTVLRAIYRSTLEGQSAQIVPNPSAGSADFVFDFSAFSPQVRVSVYTTHGKTVSSWLAPVTPGMSKIALPEGLRSGAYVVRVAGTSQSGESSLWIVE